MTPLIPLENALPVVSGSVAFALGVIGVVCFVAVKVGPRLPTPASIFSDSYRYVERLYLVHCEGFQGRGMRQ